MYNVFSSERRFAVALGGGSVMLLQSYADSPRWIGVYMKRGVIASLTVLLGLLLTGCQAPTDQELATQWGVVERADHAAVSAGQELRKVCAKNGPHCPEDLAPAVLFSETKKTCEEARRRYLEMASDWNEAYPEKSQKPAYAEGLPFNSLTNKPLVCAVDQ